MISDVSNQGNLVANSLVNVYLVRDETVVDNGKIITVGTVIGMATDRRLLLLPNDHVGVHYQGKVLEVYRCPDGNLIITLAGESWLLEDCREPPSENNFSYLPTTPYLESALERYIYDEPETTTSGYSSAIKNTSETIHYTENIDSTDNIQSSEIDENSIHPHSKISKTVNQHIGHDIEDLELSVRSANALLGNDIHTVRELVLISEVRLSRFPHLGKQSLNEIKNLMASLGLHFEMSQTEIDNHAYFSESISVIKNSRTSLLPRYFDPNSQLVTQPISDLDLSKRSLSALNSKGIITISDLIGIKKVDLLRTTSLGKSSVDDIQTKIEKLGMCFGMLPENNNANLKHNNFRKSIPEALYPNRKKLEDWILDILPSKRRNLLDRLVGLCTLETAGSVMNITRERVRQLQSKYESKFTKYLHIHIDELNQLELNTSDPFYLFMLPLHLPYFDKIHKYIPNPNSFFTNIFDHERSNYRIEWIDDDPLLVAKELPELAEILFSIKKLGLADDYRHYLASIQREDLSDYIAKYLKTDIPKSNAGKIKKYLRIIFDKTSHLKTGPELINLLLDNYNVKAKQNEVSNAIKNLGDIFLFAERSWGSEEKFATLCQNDISNICCLVIPWLKTAGVIGIHTDNLLTRLRDSIADASITLNGKLDKYQLEYALKKSAETNLSIKYKGRSFWGYGDITKRKTVMSVAIEVLHIQGGPLSTSELKEKIQKKRSVGKNFQLRPSKNYPDLIQLEPDKWGLRERDLPEVSSQTESLLFEAILSYFKTEGPIIDNSVLAEIIQSIGVGQNCSFYAISRLLLRYSSSVKPEKMQPLRVHTSNVDAKILIVDPKYKGHIPEI